MLSDLEEIFERYQKRVSNPSWLKRVCENMKKLYPYLYFWQRKDLEKQLKKQIEELVEQKKEEVKHE